MSNNKFNGLWAINLKKEKRVKIIQRYLFDNDICTKQNFKQDDYWYAVYVLVNTGFPKLSFSTFVYPYIKCYQLWVKCSICDKLVVKLGECFKLNIYNDDGFIVNKKICHICNNRLINIAEDIIRINGNINYNKLQNRYLLCALMFKINDLVKVIGQLLYCLYV
jgi:hypothetical protein